MNFGSKYVYAYDHASSDESVSDDESDDGVKPSLVSASVGGNNWSDSDEDDGDSFAQKKGKQSMMSKLMGHFRPARRK